MFFSKLPVIYDYNNTDYINDIKGMLVPVIVGKGNNYNITIDIVKEPNLLISGTQNSGKTNLVRSIITGLILCTNPIDIFICSPKPYELMEFSDSPSIRDICYNHETANEVLNTISKEIDMRYTLLSKYGEKDRNILIRDYEIKPIVLVVDEFILLADNKNILNNLIKINMMGYGCFVYTVISSQRQDIFTKSMINNSSNSISFRTNGESKNLLTDESCKYLTVQGRCLVRTYTGDILLAQVPYVSNDYIKNII